jgi:PAS domain S-box-containing protein
MAESTELSPQRPEAASQREARGGAFDWSATPLGPPSSWTPALKAAVDAMLGPAAPRPAERIADSIEAALRDGEERLRVALSAGRMGIWRFDLATGAQEWSDRQFEVFGLDPASTAPSRGLFLSLVHPDDRQMVEIGPEQLLPGAGIIDTEFRIIRPDGEIRWITSHSLVRHDRQGNPTEVIGVNWDITGRKRAEEALRHSEEGLRIALEAGRMGTYRFNVRTGIEEWSDGEYELMGVERTNAPPTRELFLSLVHPDDRELVEFTLDDQRPPGASLDSEFRIIRPDGEVRWMSAHARAIFGPDGRPAELIGVNQDITEQKRAQEALRSSEERMREFGEASSDELWIREAESLQLEYLSPAYNHIYGISRQDALRGDNFDSWLELIVPEDRERTAANIERIRAGERVAFEYRIRRPADGEIRWLRDTDFPIRDERGRVARIGGIGQDITELKAAQEHQRFLLAELQHRVRNTLAVIRAIARRTAASSATSEDYASHLEGRIDAFARVQAAATRDPAAGVELGTIVAEELSAAAAREGERIGIEGPPVKLRSKAAEAMGLAVHELATNAVKYGALAARRGRIDVHWGIEAHDGSQVLHFLWQERGLDAPLSPPTRRGFGTEILERTLAYQYRGKTSLNFEPQGLSYEVELPMERIAAHSSNGQR